MNGAADGLEILRHFDDLTIAGCVFVSNWISEVRGMLVAIDVVHNRRRHLVEVSRSQDSI